MYCELYCRLTNLCLRLCLILLFLFISVEEVYSIYIGIYNCECRHVALLSVVDLGRATFVW